jgi:iron complex outermembrane receptor protein
MQNFSANITGDLFEMPAGYASFAAGYEHRNQSGYFEPDPIAASGESMGIPASPTNGGFKVDEYYFEGKLPIVADAAFADSIELTAAIRGSDYDTSTGESFDANTMKLGVLWRANENLTLRASWSEGFRAPSIGELYNGGARNDATITDPCNNSANHSACSQIWNMSFDNYSQLNPQISVQTGGYEKLKPEESESFVWGAVYSPTWFDGSDTFDSINFDLSFYDHEIDNAVQALDAQTQLNDCVAGDADKCNGIERAGLGSIVMFENGLRNIGGIRTSGTDLKIAVVLG